MSVHAVDNMVCVGTSGADVQVGTSRFGDVPGEAGALAPVTSFRSGMESPALWENSSGVLWPLFASQGLAPNMFG